MLSLRPANEIPQKNFWEITEIADDKSIVMPDEARIEEPIKNNNSFESQIKMESLSPNYSRKKQNALPLGSKSSSVIVSQSNSIRVDIIINLFVKKKDEDVHSRYRSKFMTKFLFLQSYLQMSKVPRKTNFDCLLKKVKGKVFKMIHFTMKKCLDPTYKLERLPQSFITNIKIDFNKTILNKTVLELYIENEVIENIADFTNLYIKKEKKEIFFSFVNLQFREVFEYYITSQQFFKDKLSIQKREDEKISILFCFVAHIFLEYFTFSKGNQQTKTKQKLKENKNKTKIFSLETNAKGEVHK